ncbi:hypothetical protein BT96DRAFT_925774 [Gymnopus androsaceus JB14]|uniref:Uncharacterized protein n=1 Tax=Gymnopus androsaceus JB14 TaxID=1447944 RepID=A0A6A4GZU9_9AGAR|nr:hypothetical protein BT96DRAFT_925774 [Gymnopus androsaceus JB14]
MSNSIFRLRRSRSSASTIQQTPPITSLDVLPTPTESSSIPTLEITDTRMLLERLKALNNDSIFPPNEHRQILNDIYRMVDSTWTLANLESEDNQIIQRDGVSVGTFVPAMTSILRQTIEYIENIVTRSNSRLSLSKTKRKNIAKDLDTFRNKVESIYSFAMPDIPLSPSSDRTEGALAIAASIGSAAFVVCDSVPVLGTLKPIAAGLTEICTTVQTIRSNKQLVAEILCDVRGYFRMVVRKVKRSPTAQENEELRRDMEGLFRNLQDIQKTLLKVTSKRGLRSVLSAKRDSDNLEALQRRVQHARNTFEGGLVVSTNIAAVSTITAVGELVDGMDSMRLQIMALTTSNQEPLRTDSTVTGSASSELSALPQIDVVLAPESHSSRKQWVSVEVDLDRATHKRGEAVFLLPYMAAYFFFFELNSGHIGLKRKVYARLISRLHESSLQRVKRNGQEL